jgi:hypothetical protein
MGILWTILIGFVAGVLAKLITPGDNEPNGFILPQSLASWEPSSRASWDRLSAGIAQERVLVLSVRPLGQSSCFLFGAPLLAGSGAPFPKRLLWSRSGRRLVRETSTSAPGT